MRIDTSPTMRVETETSKKSEEISEKNDLDSSPVFGDPNDQNLINIKCVLPEPPSRNVH
jgi:hypothetical protein